MKVFYYTEDLSYPFDEGIKKTAKNVLLTLLDEHEVIACSKYGSEDSTLNLQNVNSNKLLLSSKLKNIVQLFKPEVIMYLPSASATFPSLIRLRILKSYYPQAKTIFIPLQPKYLNTIYRLNINYFNPDLTLTPSTTVEEQFTNMQMKVEFLPLYTDISEISYANEQPTNKTILKKKYGVPLGKYIITHIGHLNQMRNLESLVSLQGNGNQLLIVSSSSTNNVSFKDLKLKEKLIGKGIIIIDEYIGHIKEIYYLSDLYIFPVLDEGGCIGIPLTILEAIANNIPVLTTDYGSIKRTFSSNSIALYFDEPSNFNKKVEQIKKNNKQIKCSGYETISNINTLYHKQLRNALSTL